MSTEERFTQVWCPGNVKHHATHDSSTNEIICDVCHKTFEKCPECNRYLLVDGKCENCGYTTPTTFDDLAQDFTRMMHAYREYCAAPKMAEPQMPEYITCQEDYDGYLCAISDWKAEEDKRQEKRDALYQVWQNEIQRVAQRMKDNYPLATSRQQEFVLPFEGYLYRARVQHGGVWWQELRPITPPAPAQPEEYVPTDFDYVQGSMDGAPEYQDVIDHAMHLAANYLRILHAAQEQSDTGLAALAAAVKNYPQESED